MARAEKALALDPHRQFEHPGENIRHVVRALPGQAPAGAHSAISNKISRRQVTVPSRKRFHP